MKIKSLILPLTFLIMLISPALAYYSTDLSVNVTLLTNEYAFDCVNATDDAKIYCFSASEESSGNALRRWDIDFANGISCSLGNYYTRGIIAMNKTLVWAGHGSNMWLRNITDCGALVQVNGVLSAYPTVGDAYQNGTDRWLYWGHTTNKILDEAGALQQTLGYPFGSFENDSVNSTQYFVWGTSLVLTKAVNGVNTTNVTSLCNAFNICNAGGLKISVIKASPSTTWLFVKESLPASTKYTLHRINLSKYETANWTICSLLNPQNATYAVDQAVTFSAQCLGQNTTAGTLMWYVNGTNLHNESITITTASQTFYYAHGVMPEGGHNYYVKFVDALNNQFSSTSQYFTLESLGMFPLIAGWLGDIFGIHDASTQNLLLAVILSLIGGLVTMYYTKKFSGQVFLGTFFALFFVFISAGYVPSWVAIIILIIVGIVFVQTIKSQFGGG